MKVYVVETYDELLDGGYVEPTCYASKEDAIRRAESQTYEDGDGIRHWAHWRELYMELQSGGMAEGNEHWTRESRWAKLFGTPERAARTLADLQTCSLGFDLECDECAVYSLCQSGARNDRDALLEWLRGDA